MKMEHDPDSYIKCMQEIKHRISVIEQSIAEIEKKSDHSIPQLELIALQLRKCYELLAFSSLAANRGRFVRAWNKYSKEWRLDRIVRAIERVNPGFLPRAISERPNPAEGIKAEILHLDVPKLSSQELLVKHGKLGRLMHAKNPFTKEIDHSKLLEDFKLQKSELVALLNLHTVTIFKNRVFYRVTMQGPDGNIQCAILESQDS